MNADPFAAFKAEAVNLFSFPDTEVEVRRACNFCAGLDQCPAGPACEVPERGRERRKGWAVRLWMWIQRRYG